MFKKPLVLPGQFALLMMLTIEATGCSQDGFDSDSVALQFLPGDDNAANPKAAAPGPYPLPVMSGETYTASTYAGHGNAWDFNLSGASDCGEPAVAVADGIVTGIVSTYDQNNVNCGCYGNYVQIDHDSDNYYSRYAHLTEVYVVSGQWVQKGQAIGSIGNTGAATGCHLHFQIENSSGSTTYNASYGYYSGGSKKSGTLTNGSSYQSYNNGKFDVSKSANGGTAKVGNENSVTANRVASDGFAKYYSGGSYGNNAIYYEALGCNGGDACPSMNNTNSAWLVRTGFYAWYFACGGPAYCAMGFPTGDEYAIAGGARQNFENGYLTYSSSTGAVTPHY